MTHATSSSTTAWDWCYGPKGRKPICSGRRRAQPFPQNHCHNGSTCMPWRPCRQEPTRSGQVAIWVKTVIKIARSKRPTPSRAASLWNVWSLETLRFDLDLIPGNYIVVYTVAAKVWLKAVWMRYSKKLELTVNVASRSFGWVVWHSCRMGDRSMADSRPKGSQFQLGHFRVGELLFWLLCTPCIALDLTV